MQIVFRSVFSTYSRTKPLSETSQDHNLSCHIQCEPLKRTLLNLLTIHFIFGTVCHIDVSSGLYRYLHTCLE